MKYSDILQNDDPNNSLNLLMKRINKGKAFDDEIAGFISDRIMIEDKYYKELQKLTKKQISLDDEFMGGFGRVYKEYIKLNTVIAEIHKRVTEVLMEAETKMRARLTAQDMTKIKNVIIDK
ncbi:hypothetical protein BCR36DRAFT_25044 [Piromyces finnis]|uniref:FCH domain-containing protein n=1 Tax=Piromyces finnis TaxID=1754191 RepID=A0A1Y1VE35_9FUNG|nr:hypothetical protein BCR36DRAFT_25044 [Piromyces finnis]|eukprot:ORX53364.1 hypothetical protein BCR36DRAFT_25044 [Piromyces finnis]